MRKRERQSKILSLIASHRVSNQEEMAKLLSDSGFSVTQASVSRDLEELGLVKVNGNYALREVTLPVGELGFNGIVKSGEALLVAKFAPGLASAAAVKIDAAGIPGIVGTIAGDDTIFIAVESLAKQKPALRRLLDLFGQDSNGRTYGQ